MPLQPQRRRRTRARIPAGAQGRQGGVGEAWEAIAPGRVHVALKFIRLDSALAVPQPRPLDVIRDIRHPHLLDVQFTLQVEDRLVVAMPLCDKSLTDRLGECQREGLPGLPLDELLGYMGEMAGAIDFLNEPGTPRPPARSSASSTATSSPRTSSWSAAQPGWQTSAWPRCWRPAAGTIPAA